MGSNTAVAEQNVATSQLSVLVEIEDDPRFPQFWD